MNLARIKYLKFGIVFSLVVCAMNLSSCVRANSADRVYYLCINGSNEIVAAKNIVEELAGRFSYTLVDSSSQAISDLHEVGADSQIVLSEVTLYAHVFDLGGRLILTVSNLGERGVLRFSFFQPSRQTHAAFIEETVALLSLQSSSANCVN